MVGPPESDDLLEILESDRVAALSRRVVITLEREGLRVANLGLAARGDLASLRVLQGLADNADRTLADIAEEARTTAFVAKSRLARLLTDIEAAGALVDPADLPPRPPVVAVPRPAPDSRPADDDIVVIEAPTALAVTGEGFALVDHDGSTRLLLSAEELAAAAHLCLLRPYAESRQAHRRASRRFGLDDDGFDRLAGVLHAAGVLHKVDEDSGTMHVGAELNAIVALARRRGYDRLVEACANHWDATRAEADEDPRVPVIPVTYNDLRPPLGLGMIFAYAMAHDDGRLLEHYRFEPCWAVSNHIVASAASRPSIYLFSNYLWSHDECLATSQKVKAANPANVTIHGGPNTPKYRGDAEAYFADHPDVDITVRGEGEATTTAILEALVGAMGPDGADLSVLADVAGLSYRDGDRIVHTPDRDRIADLDTIPSPYLNGLFSVFEEVPAQFAVIETNRGCPYGCTFCDWGSATLSRIRKFDMERVDAELEWIGRNQVLSIHIADANFGIYKRDVEIAERIVAVNREHGYPKHVTINFAKNTAKHLRPIIELWVDAGIITEGALSLQSMDADTLDVIERSNIKLERYEELAAQFRAKGLPLRVDIMMGLPGQSKATFSNDLQDCIDREVAVNIPRTTMLVNSPMNQPDYKATHKIEVRSGGAVVSTATFTRDDYNEMNHLRQAFYLLDNFSVLRHVSRWLRQETGIKEMAYYEQVVRTGFSEPDRWPTLAFTIRHLPRLMTPPVSWRYFIDELRDHLVTVVGVPADDSLETVLAVQHAHLPARHRTYPCTLELPHDYAAWYAEMLAAKDRGSHHTWEDEIPHLRSYPPATLVVEDTGDVSEACLGQSVDSFGFGLSWELESPVCRPSTFPQVKRDLLT